LIFSKVTFTELSHLEEVFKYPTLIPITIYPNEFIVFGEDNPYYPLNLKGTWINKEQL